MMKKITLNVADIFHLAADKYLSETSADTCVSDGQYRNRYSCLAIEDAVDNLLTAEVNRRHLHVLNVCRHLNVLDVCNTLFKGLENLGLTETMREHNNAFEDMVNATEEEKQQSRYAWLKFCALLAEEQGATVSINI